MSEKSIGREVENWVKNALQKTRLSSSTSLSLEQVIVILNEKLQSRLTSGRLYLNQDFPYANEWIDSVLSHKALPTNISIKAKAELREKLLDAVLATDVMVALRDNNGKSHLISIDVTCDIKQEKAKLNVIQGKRKDNALDKYNPNQNIPQVRKELGIDKHLVLLLNSSNLPDYEVLLDELYAFAEQPNKTGVINLYSYVPQSTLTDQLASPSQSAPEVQLDPNLAKVLSLIEQLPEKELTNTAQRVQNYLAAMPPPPPTQAEQLAVQQEIKSLLTEIPTLWQRQEQQAHIVESMKNPLQAWNKKYDAALGELQQTMKLIKEAISQKDQKETQLHEWAQTDKVYQAWLSDPQTKQMQDVAAVLKIPQIQKRINQIRQKAIGQQQQTKVEPKQQRSRPNPKSDQGLSL